MNRNDANSKPHSQWKTNLQAVWDSREPRERRLIGWAAAVLVLGGVYAGLVDPAHSGMARLKTSLPAAQAQAAQVQQLVASLQAKGGVNAGDTGKNASQAALQASLASAGIQAKVSAAAPWVVTIEAAPGDALWAWLKTNNASRSQLKRLANGSWQGDITLEP